MHGRLPNHVEVKKKNGLTTCHHIIRVSVESRQVSAVHFILYSSASNTYFSSHVWQNQCLFLDGKSNDIGESDTKHNGKALHGQIVGGGDTVPLSIGNFMVDADLTSCGWLVCR